MKKLTPKTVRFSRKLFDNFAKIKVGLFKKFILLQNHSKSCMLVFSARMPQ